MVRLGSESNGTILLQGKPQAATERFRRTRMIPLDSDPKRAGFYSIRRFSALVVSAPARISRAAREPTVR